MPRQHNNRLRRVAGAIALLLLGGLLLTACGGGGSKSTSSTSSKSASAGTGASASGRRGFAALRTCLKKEGITLPERKPGSGPGGRPGGQPRGPFGSGAPGGALQLPKGVTREQLQAALMKCGAGTFGAGRRFNGARNPQRLAKFAACMRSAGVNLPAPNTSGKGPVFNTKGIDTTSSTFKQADAKCAKELRPTGSPPSASG